MFKFDPSLQGIIHKELYTMEIQYYIQKYIVLFQCGNNICFIIRYCNLDQHYKHQILCKYVTAVIFTRECVQHFFNSFVYSIFTNHLVRSSHDNNPFMFVNINNPFCQFFSVFKKNLNLLIFRIFVNFPHFLRLLIERSFN